MRPRAKVDESIIQTLVERTMKKQRRQYSEQFKFKVALEAAKGLRTVNEIAGEYSLHPNQVSSWKKRLLEEGPAVYSRNSERERATAAKQEAELYEQIGRLKMELEWLKKKATQFG
jgi:transposase-like protein